MIYKIPPSAANNALACISDERSICFYLNATVIGDTFSRVHAYNILIPRSATAREQHQ
jgi:hypothetical protein